MNGRVKRGEIIDDQIIAALKDSEKPLSTRQLCLKISKSWHTVNSHCLKLQNQKEIGVLRFGNITLWSLNGK